jgi:hypothetical protein
MHHLGMGKGRDAHLESDASDAAQRLMNVKNLLSHSFSVTDNQRPRRTTSGIELRPGGGRPAPFFANLGEGVRVSREKIIRRLLGRIAEKPDAVEPHPQLLRSMSCPPSGLAIKFDMRAKSMRFAANNGDHQRKAQRSRASKGSRRAPDTQPDRQRIL